MRNYILCARCQSKIAIGEKFFLLETTPMSPCNPYCLSCGSEVYMLEKDDDYLSEFWEDHGELWANEIAEEIDDEEFE